jgi:hypothetical protein
VGSPEFKNQYPIVLTKDTQYSRQNSCVYCALYVKEETQETLVLGVGIVGA